MRMQLKLGRAAWWLCVAAVLFNTPGKLFSQESRVKVKKLKYDEKDPGISVDEELMEAVIQLDNLDQISMMYLHDSITGASPTGVEESTDTTTSASGGTTTGRSQEYANFDDERSAYTLGYKKFFGSDLSLLTSLNYSKENDYVSKGVSFNVDWLLNQKNTTLSFNFTSNDDRIKIVDSSEDSEKTKRVNSGGFGITQLLSQRLIAGVGLVYGESRGFHTDQYKKVKVGDLIVDESRPEARSYTSISGNVHWQFADFHSVRLNFAGYNDNWKVQSTAWDVQTMHELTEQFLISFYGRFYNQSSAYFWDSSFEAGNNDEFRTSDNRLSSFSSNTLSATVYYLPIESVTLEASYGNYKQYEGNPALLEEDSFFVRLDGDDDDDYDDDDDDDDDDDEGIFNRKKAITEATIWSLAAEYRF